MKKYHLYSVLFLGGLLLSTSCKDDDNVIRPNFEASNTTVKAGGKVTFNDVSIGNVSAWNWTFEGGTPETSQLSQPEITYNTKGQYAVTLEVRNLDGIVTITKENFIIVGNSEVVADFSSSTMNVMNDTPVTFTDLSTGSVSNWTWTFTPASGEAVISTERNPEIIFINPGVYSVELEVSNEDYSDTKILENYLTVIDAANVIADFTSDIQFTYEGGSITFSDKSVGRIVSWLWEFEGANITTSTAQNPIVTFTTAGSHKVKLTASNGNIDNSMEKEQYINIISSNGLSSFFRFDGVIKDELSSVVTSKIEEKGQITFDITDRKNQSANAAGFDGTGGFIIKNDNAFNFGTENYTIAVWLKVEEAYSTTRMVPWQESGAGGSGDNQTWLRLYSTATNQLTFATEDATGASTIHLTQSNSPDVNNIANGQWRHVVCVRSGTRTRLYVDGVERRNGNANAVKNVSNAGDFKVGFQESGTNFTNKYIGAMDDLIIYKRALSAQEIETLYTY
jgi:PKD repeat protein